MWLIGSKEKFLSHIILDKMTLERGFKAENIHLFQTKLILHSHTYQIYLYNN